MQRIRSYGPSLVLLVTILAVLAGGPWAMRQLAWAQQDARIQMVRNQLDQNKLLARLNEAFSNVADAVRPSVVSIQVKRFGQRSSNIRRFESPIPREQIPEELRRFFRIPREGETERPDPRSESYREYNVPHVYGSGSGWVYDEQGHIITNYHVIENADAIEVIFYNGVTRPATVVGADPLTDIAVLKVESGPLHPAEIATEPVEQGDIVFAFGSPFRFKFSMSQGIVSGVGRQLGMLVRKGGYEHFIQTDAAVNPGNSGGPLVNIYGEVVGMNSAIATRTNSFDGLSFAIPVQMVVNVAEQIINEGEVERGKLGVYIGDISPQMAQTFGYEGEGGVLVQQVIPGSPADQAGFQAGDIILAVNGEQMVNASELRRTIARYAPGTEIEVRVFRSGQTLTIDVTLGERRPQQIARVPGDEATRDAASDSTESTIAPEALDSLHKLGIAQVGPLTERMAKRLGLEQQLEGVVIKQVRPSSVAASKGLRSGIIITDVAGDSVEDVQDLAEALNEQDLAKGVRMRIRVRGQSRFIFLALPTS